MAGSAQLDEGALRRAGYEAMSVMMFGAAPEMLLGGRYSRDRTQFERVMRAMAAEIANAGAHLGLDAHSRLLYTQQIQAIAHELRSEVARGRLTWKAAAEQAVEARNAIMEVIRGRTTPVGLAIAQNTKLHGQTLNELIAKSTVERFGSEIKFEALTPAQRNQVYASVVASSGRPSVRFTRLMSKMSRAGRGLLFLSLAASVHHISTAENKAAAAAQELTVTGAGIGGGIAGGALAGLACGPGTPVCVTIGAFMGGALAAFGVDMLW